MTDLPRKAGLWNRLTGPLTQRPLLAKAASFASIGVVNGLVNYVLFWLMLRAVAQVPALAHGIQRAADLCGCVSAENAGVILANVVAWAIAVSGSYVMNSMTTFAAESGRKLRWRSYVIFAASGILGMIADTATLLIVKSFLPIMLAKLMAIGAGFVVNFSMSHFVVFRTRPANAGDRAVS